MNELFSRASEIRLVNSAALTKLGECCSITEIRKDRATHLTRYTFENFVNRWVLNVR